MFSPDGKRFLTGSDGNTARLWDAATGKAVATPAGETAPVTAIAFSSDGTRVLIDSLGGTARLWDATAVVHQTANPQPNRRAHARR